MLAAVGQENGLQPVIGDHVKLVSVSNYVYIHGAWFKFIFCRMPNWTITNFVVHV